MPGGEIVQRLQGPGSISPSGGGELVERAGLLPEQALGVAAEELKLAGGLGRGREGARMVVVGAEEARSRPRMKGMAPGPAAAIAGSGGIDGPGVHGWTTTAWIEQEVHRAAIGFSGRPQSMPSARRSSSRAPTSPSPPGSARQYARGSSRPSLFHPHRVHLIGPIHSHVVPHVSVRSFLARTGLERRFPYWSSRFAVPRGTPSYRASVRSSCERDSLSRILRRMGLGLSSSHKPHALYP